MEASFEVIDTQFGILEALVKRLACELAEASEEIRKLKAERAMQVQMVRHEGHD